MVHAQAGTICAVTLTPANTTLSLSLMLHGSYKGKRDDLCWHMQLIAGAVKKGIICGYAAGDCSSAFPVVDNATSSGDKFAGATAAYRTTVITRAILR